VRGNLFGIAGGLVLREKQLEYEKMDERDRYYAIDYFGVRSINQYYFARKIGTMLDARTVNATFYHLARTSLEELETMTGPLRYMTELRPHQ
jgi:hypothetical protein